MHENKNGTFNLFLSPSLSSELLQKKVDLYFVHNRQTLKEDLARGRWSPGAHVSGEALMRIIQINMHFNLLKMFKYTWGQYFTVGAKHVFARIYLFNLRETMR